MGVEAERWLAAYAQHRVRYERATEMAIKELKAALKGTGIEIHQVSGRAKSISSVEEKIVRKNYGRPRTQMTDLIGLRVITAYGHAVEDVSKALREAFSVDEDLSSNKTAKLGVSAFGYRSDHLVLKMDHIKGGLNDASAVLSRSFIEVQVRSVVAHAWAEIEHSLRYKSGIELSSDLSRRFNAVASTLELVDREFSAIEEALIDEVNNKKVQLEKGVPVEGLTSVGLLALLAARRPEAHRLGPRSVVLPLRQANFIAKLLIKVGVLDLPTLDKELADPRFLKTVRTYAEIVGVRAKVVSAFAITGILIGLRDVDLVKRIELFDDPAVVEALEI